MMRNVFLLLICITMLSVLKLNKSSRSTQLVRIDLVGKTKVTEQVNVYVPRTLKFGALVVNPNYRGTITLKMGSQVFEYKRPLEYTRNEYVLEGVMDETVNLRKGDTISAEFSTSNMTDIERITLFGEKEV